MVRLSAVTIAGLAATFVVGCGSSGNSNSGSPGGSASSSGGAGLLSAEARSAATGDIKDTQAFVVFRDSQARYKIKYPEGWTQRGSGPDVSFSDKNNIVHVVVSPGSPPTTATLSSELGRLRASNPTLSFHRPKPIQLTAGPALEATYTTRSAPNPVTGKRVQLIVNRYELARAGKRVTVDLGTPTGVDNVDAYRLMINSFGWQ